MALQGCPGDAAVSRISACPQRGRRLPAPTASSCPPLRERRDTHAAGLGHRRHPATLMRGLVRRVRAWPPFVPLTPGHWGLHTLTLAPVGGRGGWLRHLGVCPSATQPRVSVVLCPAGTTRSVHACVQGVGSCVRVCACPICAQHRVAPCPAEWGATPPKLSCPWCPGATPQQCPLFSPYSPSLPSPPAGCKLSCHTKCQAKVRPVPWLCPSLPSGHQGLRGGMPQSVPTVPDGLWPGCGDTGVITSRWAGSAILLPGP